MKIKKYINVLKDKERKSLSRMTLDVILLSLKEKVLPVHYFTRLLYKKSSPENYSDYLSLIDIRKLYRNYFNKNINKNLFEDKSAFHRVLEGLNIPTPESIGLLIGNNMILESGKIYKFNEVNQLKSLLKDIISKRNHELFIKPNNGINGLGCFAYTYESDYIPYNELLNGSYLIQEKIEQDSKMKSLNESSINTLRVNTINVNGIQKVLSIILRIGINKRHVDNRGIFIKVNSKSGNLAEKAYSFLEYGAKTYTEHPNSKVCFRNFQVPHIDEVRELALKCARVFSSDLVGWDIAISNKGPILIEGNHNPDFGMADIADRGLKRNKEFKNLLNQTQSK